MVAHQQIRLLHPRTLHQDILKYFITTTIIMAIIIEAIITIIIIITINMYSILLAMEVRTLDREVVIHHIRRLMVEQRVAASVFI